MMHAANGLNPHSHHLLYHSWKRILFI